MYDLSYICVYIRGARAAVTQTTIITLLRLITKLAFWSSQHGGKLDRPWVCADFTILSILTNDGIYKSGWLPHNEGTRRRVCCWRSRDTPTIDQVVLINTIRNEIGIAGIALEYIHSYLSTIINLLRFGNELSSQRYLPYMEYLKAPCLAPTGSYWTVIHSATSMKSIACLSICMHMTASSI